MNHHNRSKSKEGLKEHHILHKGRDNSSSRIFCHENLIWDLSPWKQRLYLLSPTLWLCLKYQIWVDAEIHASNFGSRCTAPWCNTALGSNLWTRVVSKTPPLATTSAMVGKGWCCSAYFLEGGVSWMMIRLPHGVGNLLVSLEEISRSEDRHDNNE